MTTDAASVPVDRRPSLNITKDATVPGGTADAAGEQISYVITVANTGNTTLTGLTMVDDNYTPGNTADDIPVTLDKTTLLPGEQVDLLELEEANKKTVEQGGKPAALDLAPQLLGPVAHIPGLQIVRFWRALAPGEDAERHEGEQQRRDEETVDHQRNLTPRPPAAEAAPFFFLASAASANEPSAGNATAPSAAVFRRSRRVRSGAEDMRVNLRADTELQRPRSRRACGRRPAGGESFLRWPARWGQPRRPRVLARTRICAGISARPRTHAATERKW